MEKSTDKLVGFTVLGAIAITLLTGNVLHWLPIVSALVVTNRLFKEKK